MVFEVRVLRYLFGPKGEKVTGTAGNCMLRRL